MLVNHWLIGFLRGDKQGPLTCQPLCIFIPQHLRQTPSALGSFLTHASESIFPREEDLSSSVPVLWHPGSNREHHGGSSPWSSVLLKPVPSHIGGGGSASCTEEMEPLSFDTDLQKGVFVTTPSSQLRICVSQNWGTHGLLTTWTLLWC